MKVYIAAKFGTYKRVRVIANQLEMLFGHEVVSSWHGKTGDGLPKELLVETAVERDIGQLKTADALLVFDAAGEAVATEITEAQCAGIPVWWIPNEEKISFSTARIPIARIITDNDLHMIRV